MAGDGAPFPPGTVAVIFVAQRTPADEPGYAAAARAMDEAAARFPGCRGIRSARGPDGIGITISYWADDAAARAWKADPAHAAIREQGRGRWYAWYEPFDYPQVVAGLISVIALR